MIKPRPTQGCLGKIAYATRPDANQAASHVRVRPGFRNPSALESYHCHVCGKFHLGKSRRDGPVKAIRKVPDHRPDSYQNRKSRYAELAK